MGIPLTRTPENERKNKMKTEDAFTDSVPRERTTHRVYFKDVGRAKKSWETTLASLDGHSLLKAVKKQHAIASRYPEFVVHETSMTGRIFCGFRLCGTFTYTTTIAPKDD